MAQPSLNDPFFWDIDRVCKELCYDGAEWANDISALESRLRENLVDGETLLTYELTFSKKELMECLAVKAARHRAKLARKIMNLQNQSPKFREEKSCIESGNAPEAPQQAQTPIIPVPSPYRGAPATSTPDSAQLNTVSQGQSKTSHESRKKPRRVVPTLVSDIQPGIAAPRMNGFEEPQQATVQVSRVARAGSPVRDSPTAYLGKHAVTQDLYAHYDSDSGSDTFGSIANPSQPRGKKRAIYSIVKRYLLKNNRKVSEIQSGANTGAPSDQGQEIFDFDDLASFDEDTLREIEDEEEEKKNRPADPSKLDSLRVEEVIKEELAKIKEVWEEKKLPKHQRAAYRLWTQARKHGLLRQQAFAALKQAEYFRNRLSKLSKELIALSWDAEDDLRFHLHVVEQTVVDKLHQEWLINLFSLRSAPPKPPPQQRNLPRPKTFIHKDELSSSDEEEDLSNFILDDEPAFADSARSPLSPAGRHSPLHLRSPHSPTSSIMLPPASQPESFIDLTQASDVEMESAEVKLVPSTFDPVTQSLLAQIGNTSPKVWAEKKDRFRLVISILWKLDFDRREALFQTLAGSSISNIWMGLVDKAHERLDASDQTTTPDAAFDLTLVYLSFFKCRYYKEQKVSNMSEKDVDKFEDSEESFPPFCGFLATIKDEFPQRNQIARLDEFDDELMELDDLPDEATSKSVTTKKNRKKAIVLDKSGVELREREARDAKEREQRRDKNLASMQFASPSDVAAAQLPRFIINESKADNEGFIYVHPKISTRIKDHQIEGVRFLWNHIVQDQSRRQGCLLAHTMGLGKTMQTITFLVALRESALSPDPTVRDQIPRDLLDWRVLVLCPAGLVENWREEFDEWAPERLLGEIVTISAAQSPYDRLKSVRDWEAHGGVLIIGYTMFKSGFRKGDEDNVTIDRILVERATVVVADEAHTLKSPKAKITQVASELKTSTRIALTGSPLANNVEEYYAMINWVAPNFLGPLQEFRDMYATPIHQGLYHDSTNYEKRKAMKLLQALKTTAAPKVHRATIKSCLKHELPPKEEFVISVPPTDLQRSLYDLYMQGTHSSGEKVNQANLFGVLNHLALICAHPAAYRKRVIELKTQSDLGRDVARFPMETIPRILKMTTVPNLDRTELSYKVELLNKILDQSSRLGDKVLVFSQSIPTLNYLSSLFDKQNRKFCRLDGSTQISKRQDMVKKFNKGDEMVYLISTNAGGVGLNIHGANRVIIFDFKWNPVQDQQAIGRAYRIGQTKPVFVYRFVVAGSFEDDLQNKAVFKMQLASRVVDQKNPVSWSKRLANLMHLIKDVDATDARFEFKGKDSILDHLLDHDKSRAILSIMSSDTFEEEDETATLTAEERQEADSMVERHNLRMTDPEKYIRVMEAERVASNQRLVSNIASSKPNKDWFPDRPCHAFETPMLSSVIAPPASAPVAQTPAGVPMPVLKLNPHGSRGRLESTTASSSNGNGLPTISDASGQVPAPTYSAAPMPILGANTYYGTSGGSDFTPVYPLRSNGVSAFSEQSCRAAREKFQQKLAFALTSLGTQHPQFLLDTASKAASITNDIEAELEKQQKGLSHDTLRWGLLSGKLGNQKVLLAIASGQLSGNFLSRADEENMQARIQLQESIRDEWFLANIEMGGKPKDPEVRRSDQEEAQHPDDEEESKN